MKIEIKKLRQLKLEKDDILVIEEDPSITPKAAEALSHFLKVKVIIVPDINKVGAIKKL
jgi:superfamily I DNA and RNA helicase